MRGFISYGKCIHFVVIMNESNDFLKLFNEFYKRKKDPSFINGLLFSLLNPIPKYLFNSDLNKKLTHPPTLLKQ